MNQYRLVLDTLLEGNPSRGGRFAETAPNFESYSTCATLPQGDFMQQTMSFHLLPTSVLGLSSSTVKKEQACPDKLHAPSVSRLHSLTHLVKNYAVQRA